MNATTYKKLAAVGIVPLILLATGCLATRKFVRNSQAPQDTRIQSVDQKTSQNTQDIKELGEKTEAGISRAQNSANEANQAAQQASQQAQAANQTAESGLAAANQAQGMFNNLQNYQAAQHTAVLFDLNKSTLTAEGEQKLDELAQSVGSLKLYVIQVVGHTDNTGSKQYNLALSQRRADAVVRYLAEHHNIPVVQIHTIGYGEDVPVAPNDTRQGRSENRRVEITVLVPQLESQSAQSGQMTPAGN